jgi:hypothetical protein
MRKEFKVFIRLVILAVGIAVTAVFPMAFGLFHLGYSWIFGILSMDYLEKGL